MTRGRALERDLAKKADLEGGPTAHAYETACAALEHAKNVNAILFERLGQVEAVANKIRPIIGELVDLNSNVPALTTSPEILKRVTDRVIEVRRRQLSAATAPTTAVMVSRDRGEGALGKGERAVLTAIAQHSHAGCSREQITVLTRYKRSTRDLYIQRLVRRRLVTVDRAGVKASDNLF